MKRKRIKNRFLSCITFLVLFSSNFFAQDQCGIVENPLPECTCVFCDEPVEAVWELVNDNVIVCEGEEFQLSGELSTPLDKIEEFRWYFVDAIEQTVVFDTIIYDTSPVKYIYEVNGEAPCNSSTVNLKAILIVIADDSCPDGRSCNYKQSSVIVKLKPRASFSAEPKVCVNTDVEFENTSCNGEEYFWDFGDNTTSTGENPTHQYTQPGIYNITLIAENECGESDPFTRQIEVIGLPEANALFTPDPTPICAPQTIFFQNHSIFIDSLLQHCPDDFFEWEISPDEGWNYISDFIMINDSTTIEIPYNNETWNTQVEFITPGLYDIQLTVDNICNQPDTWTETIEVFERPTVSLENVESICLGVDASSIEVDLCELLNHTGSVCGYNWSILKGNSAFDTNQDLTQECFQYTFTEIGNYTISVELNGCGCGNTTAQITFGIADPGQSIITSPSGTEICTGDAPFNLSANTSGTWTSTPSGLIDNNGHFDPSQAEDGIVTIFFEPFECSSSSNLELTIYESSEVNLESIEPACDELTITPQYELMGTYSQVTWTTILEDGTINEDNSSTPPTITFPIGNHQFAVTTDGSCGLVTDTIEVAVLASETINITTPPQPLCNTSDVIIVAAIPSGGTWSNSSNLITSQGEFDPSQAPINNPITLVYTVGEGTICEKEASVVIMVTEAIEVNIESNLTLCEDAAPYQLLANPVDGVWEGEGVDSMGLFNPNGLSTDTTYNLNYNYEDPNGCAVVKSTTVFVEALPTLAVGNFVELCTSSMDIDLNDVININTSPETGVLTFEGMGVSSDGMFNSQAIGAITGDTIQITVFYDLIDCRISDSFEILLIERTDANAGQDEKLCIGEEAFIMVGTPSNGVWNQIGGNNTGLDTSTGELDLALVEGGVHLFEYIIQMGTSCEERDTTMIEIIDLTGIDAGNDFGVCEDAEPVNLSGTPSNGTWSGEGINADNNTFNPTGLSPGVYELVYHIEDQEIDCATEDVIEVTIEPLPTASFEITGTTCINEEFEINNLSELACDFIWNFGDGSPPSASASPTHTYTETGTYTISLVATSCSNLGCNATFSIDVFVTEPPIALFVTDIDEGCAPLEVNFFNQSNGTDISHEWDFGNGQTSTATDPENIVFEQANTDTTYQITLAVTNDCGTRYYTDSITVFPIPVANFGTNEDEGCSPLEIIFANGTVGNPESFDWFINDVFMTSDTILPDTFFTTTDTTITTYDILLVSSNFCGIDSFERSIIVYPPNVDAFFHIDTLNGCEPFTIELTNYSTPGATITYDFGDGNGSSEENIQYTYEEEGIYTITQTATNCGIDSAFNQVTVLPAPEVSFITDSYVCLGQTVTFTNTSAGITGSQWHFGDGNISNADSPSHVFDSTGIYNVVLTGFSELNNCPAIFEQEIEVRGNPFVSFEPSSYNGCVPFNVSFDNNSESNLVYQWDFGDGETSNIFSPTHIFSDAGIYEVSLITTDEYGCFEDTSVVNIIVHNNPISIFQTDAETYCARYDTIHTNNTSQGAVMYHWITTDTLNVFEPDYLLTEPGFLDITLIVENEFQCKDTSSQSIEILETPLGIPQDMIQGCPALTVNFNTSAQYANIYEWNFGDGNSSTSAEPQHIYTVSDTFEVQAIVSNTNGCPSDTVYQDIIVRPAPTAQFELTRSEQCGFTDTIDIANTSVGSVDYFWNDGNSTDYVLFEPVILYPDTGTYNINLIAQNTFGCQDTFEQNITILPSPIANISTNTANGCAPLSIQLEDISTYSNGNIWILDDGNFGNNESYFQNTFEESASYEVALIAIHSNTCPSDTAFATIDVFPIPISSFSIGDTIICGVPTEIQIENLAIDTISYDWSFGNGLTSTDTEPIITYNETGNYVITEITTNIYNCMDTMEQTIQLYQQPYVDISPESATICEGEDIVFTNLSTNLDSLVTFFGDGNWSEDMNPTYTYNELGNYDLEIIAINNNTCFDTLFLEHAVTVLERPNADFTQRDSCSGLIVFENLSTPLTFNNYYWDFDDGHTSTAVSPQHEFFTNGEKNITLIAEYNECSDTIMSFLTPKFFYNLSVPNAFSPDSGEGEVRLFKPKGIGLIDYHMEVYSRWGKLVWESRLLQEEQPAEAWNGIIIGQRGSAPQGVYTWRYQVTYVNGLKEVKTGVVHLLR